MSNIKMFPVPKDGVRPQDVYHVSEDFVGSSLVRGEGDINHLCGHCDAVLFENMSTGQIDGAGVMECHMCHGYNKFPIVGSVAHPNDPFESAKSSLKWAKEHVRDFEVALNQFINSQPYRHSFDIDPSTGEYIHKLKLVHAPSDQVRKFARAAMQDLREVLDKIVFTLTGKEKIQIFPFGTDLKNFESRLASEERNKLPTEIKNLFRALKPYKGGNDMLYALQEASNPNKHGDIRPVVTVTKQVTITGGTSGKGGIKLTGWDSTKNEMEIGRFMPGTQYRTPDLNIAFDITIGGVDSISGKPLLPVLHEVSHILEGFVVAVEAQAIRLKMV